jgi:hypothetical protein
MVLTALEKLKLVLPSDHGLSDDELEAIILESDSFESSAALVWESISAKKSTLVDVEESGSRRSMSQAAIRANAQAVYWRGRGVGLSGTTTGGTTGKIVRG